MNCEKECNLQLCVLAVRLHHSAVALSRAAAANPKSVQAVLLTEPTGSAPVAANRTIARSSGDLVTAIVLCAPSEHP